MTKNITTSWVIRTKNEEKHLGEVLEMLKKQTYQDFEIIIVDSGSTNKTLEIIKKFSARLFQIKPEEFNYSYGLNLGISKTRGQFIGILSGHSIPQSLSFYADALKFFSNPKVAAVTGYYYDGKGVLGKIPLPRKEQHYCPWMTNTNSIIRKDLWRLYPFDERLTEGCEDYDWGSEMIARGYDIVKTPLFSTVYYRVNNKPSCQKMKPVWEKICAKLDKKHRPSRSYTKIEF